MTVLKLLSGPIIGAIIGYCTNYIAVKMLFRPLRPVKLFGRQLPFTPGIIPKGKARLARAIGGVVGTQLLTEDDLKQTLMSNSVTESLRRSIDGVLESKSETTLREVCCKAVDETQYDAGSAVMQEKLAETLAEHVNDMQLGDTIAQQVLEAVRQKVSGSLIGMMLSGDMLDSFAGPIRDGVDNYLQGNAYALLYPQVTKLWGEAEQKNIGDVNALLTDAGVSLTDVVLHIYEAAVSEKAASILHSLDLGGIAEQKVNAMQPEELERLVLSVMKKELNAVVSLGALVGFILGLLNLIF